MESIPVKQIEKTIKDEALIPYGSYCYEHTGETRMVNKAIGYNGELIDLNASIKMPRTKNCPYWSLNQKGEAQNNGFCGFLMKGDGDVINNNEPIDLLWDQIKICGRNEE